VIYDIKARTIMKVKERRTIEIDIVQPKLGQGLIKFLFNLIRLMRVIPEFGSDE
jgi:hypothetical protein